MDFINVLKVAAAKKSADTATKRYSLAVGPPKKDPKVKGVQSAAVQAFLRRKEEEIRLKELEEKRKKEDLLAKRKELKHDKKARAMASRTKDNFRGYNGVPMEEKPRKRGSSPQRDPETSGNAENDDYLTEEEMYEFSQTESEQEEVEEPPPPPKKQKLSNTKKPPPPAMNFAELLRLAEKKQYEPVEIAKPVKKTSTERPRTAEEIRELEFLERKAHKVEKSEKHSKPSGQVVKVSKSSSEKHSSTKSSCPKDQKLKSSSAGRSNHEEKSRSNHEEKSRSAEKGTVKKHSDTSSRPEKHVSVSHRVVKVSSSNGTSRPPSTKDHGAKHSSSSRSEVMTTSNGKLKDTAPSKGSGSGKPSGPGAVRPSVGSGTPRPPGSSSSGSGRSSGGSASARPTSSSAPMKSPSGSGSVRPPGSSGSSSHRPPGGSGSAKTTGGSGSTHPSKGGHSNGSSSSARPSGASRPGSGTPLSASKPKSIPSGKELGSSVRQHGGPTLGSSKLSSSSAPVRPSSNPAMAPGSKPKCTVVSETISSKNFVPKTANGPVNGMRPGQANGMRPGQANGMRPGQANGMRPGQANGMRPMQAPSGHRLMARPPGPPLPPITSSYKRVIDDEEYDSEMEDFIDDGGEDQDEISKHIREIFGYDRNKYKDESDYALRYMESTFREQQKEEARSLRLGIQEDLEELKREEEELKIKAKLEKAKKMKKR